MLTFLHTHVSLTVQNVSFIQVLWATQSKRIVSFDFENVSFTRRENSAEEADTTAIVLWKPFKLKALFI